MFLGLPGGDVAFGATTLGLNGTAALGGAIRESAMHESHRDQRLLLALTRQNANQHSPASAMVGVPGRGLQLAQAPLHDRVLELHKHGQATLAGPRAVQLPERVGKHLAGAA
jgi:hypothetical protein